MYWIFFPISSGYFRRNSISREVFRARGVWIGGESLPVPATSDQGPTFSAGEQDSFLNIPTITQSQYSYHYSPSNVRSANFCELYSFYGQISELRRRSIWGKIHWNVHTRSASSVWRAQIRLKGLLGFTWHVHSVCASRLQNPREKFSRRKPAPYKMRLYWQCRHRLGSARAY